AGNRSRSTDDPQRSRTIDAFPNGGPTHGHAGDHQVPQPAARLRRQPIFGEPVQDAQVPAKIPVPLRQYRTPAGLLPQVLSLAEPTTSSPGVGPADPGHGSSRAG